MHIFNTPYHPVSRASATKIEEGKKKEERKTYASATPFF